MNKKAISPLIATVLIIGFTIVLAAVVLQWAGGFVKNLTAEQEKTVNLQTACMGMNLEITSAILEKPVDGALSNLTIKIANNNAEKEVAGAIVLIETTTERITVDADVTNTNAIPILGSKDINILTNISWNGAAIQQWNLTNSKIIKAGNKVLVVPKVKIGADTKPCDVGVAAEATIA